MTNNLPDYRFVTTADLEQGVRGDHQRRAEIAEAENHTFPNVVRWPGAIEEIERRTSGSV